MKKIDKNAYKETRLDKSHLMVVGIIVALIAIALLGGGGWLFARGIIVSGVWSTLWRIVLGAAMVLLGGTFGIVAIMMISTAFSMIKVKNGNVSDVGNSGMGTVNVLKCHKCGAKLDEAAEHCNKCGASLAEEIKCECGHKNDIDSTHCAKCGKELK